MYMPEKRFVFMVDRDLHYVRFFFCYKYGNLLVFTLRKNVPISVLHIGSACIITN